MRSSGCRPVELTELRLAALIGPARSSRAAQRKRPTLAPDQRRPRSGAALDSIYGRIRRWIRSGPSECHFEKLTVIHTGNHNALICEISSQVYRLRCGYARSA